MIGKNMPYYTRNTGKEWTNKDTTQLKSLAKSNTPTRVIGFKLGRTPAAIYNKASEKGVDLSPTNQRPYNRGK